MGSSESTKRVTVERDAENESVGVVKVSILFFSFKVFCTIASLWIDAIQVYKMITLNVYGF